VEAAGTLKFEQPNPVDCSMPYSSQRASPWWARPGTERR